LLSRSENLRKTQDRLKNPQRTKKRFAVARAATGGSSLRLRALLFPPKEEDAIGRPFLLLSRSENLRKTQDRLKNPQRTKKRFAVARDARGRSSLRLRALLFPPMKKDSARGAFHKAGLPAANIVGRWLAAAENKRQSKRKRREMNPRPTKNEYEQFCSYSFLLLSGGNKPPLCKGRWLA